MARSKAKDGWRSTLKELLVPKLIKALKNDATGTVPLRTPQRRACRAIMRLAMSDAQIQTVLAPSKGSASRRPKTSRQVRKRRKVRVAD